MRCLVCGAIMRLQEGAIDETAPVSGFKRHTFRCPNCGDIEQRLAFVKEVEPSHADAIPSDSAPPVVIPLDADAAPPFLVPSAGEKEDDAAAPSFAKRVFASLSNVCRAIGRWRSHGRALRSPVSDLWSPHASTPRRESVAEAILPATPPSVAEPASAPTAPSSFVLGEIDGYVDECENLLRRAIKMVGVPTPASQASASLAEAASSARAVETATMASSVPEIDSAAPTLASSFAQAESAAPTMEPSLPETASAPRTIASSRLEAGSAAPNVASSLPETMASNLAEAESAVEASDLPEPASVAPTVTTSSFEAEPAVPVIPSNVPETRAITSTRSGFTQAESSPTRRLVVRIQYDSEKAKYVVTDSKTGTRILRLHDITRLRAMCDRMGWQVVDG
jgi:hypothetical protein